MEVTQEEIAANLARLADSELIARIQTGELTPFAQRLAHAELSRRGLTSAAALAQPSAAEAIPRPSGSELVVLTRFNEPWPAEILRARLEVDGIDASLADQNLVSSNWFLSTAVGGVRVMVPADQRARAQSIMAAIQHGDYALTGADDASAVDAKICCPRCGSERVSSNEQRKRRAWWTLFLLSIPLPFSRNDKRCDDCGFEWREK